MNRDRRHGLDSSGSKQVSVAGFIEEGRELDDLQPQKKEKLLNTNAAILRTVYNYNSNIKFG